MDCLLVQTSNLPHISGDQSEQVGWRESLEREIDSYVGVVQNIREGLDFAFLISARLVFERWTTNRALSTDEPKGGNEREVEYFARVWGDAMPNVAKQVASDWAWVSELIHGRAEMNQISRDFSDLASTKPSTILSSKVTNSAFGLCEVAVRQLLAGVGVHAQSRGVEASRAFVLGTPVNVTEHDPTWPSLLELIVDIVDPLDPMVINARPSRLKQLADKYEALLARPGSLRVYERASIGLHLAGCLASHRMRRIELERKHFLAEMKSGREIMLERQLSWLYRFGAFGELALMLGQQDDSPECVALRTAGMALSSAWPLWLADDDVSVACMRTVFEQVARARTHRLKPGKAAKMEAKRQPPGRWLEAAGYARLNELGIALNEFSHFSHRSMRHDARKVLTAAQFGNDADAKFTARGFLLKQGSYLLATEIAERLGSKYPKLAVEFSDEVALADLSDEHEALDEYLNLGLSLRGFEWKQKDFYDYTATAAPEN